MRRSRTGLYGLALGLALIWALFVPLFGDHGFGLDLRPPVALFGVLVLFGFLGQMRWTLPAWLRWTLAVLIALLALLQFAAAGVEQILDRGLDLYFDLARVPDLVALYLNAAGARGVIVLVAAALGIVLLLWLTSRALVAIERAMARPAPAVGALVVGVLGLALTAMPFAPPINAAAAVVAEQQAANGWRAFAVFHGLDNRYAAALRAPQLPMGPLPGLKDKDVYLVFIESYGTVTLDDPGYRRILAPVLADFAATVQGAGYTLMSSRLVSPVFGGGSWLAHGTLASGVKLDALANELLLNSPRKSLPRYLAAAGYRTVEVMPGIKKPDPEASFWGFDAHYFSADLGYGGPEFGWFDIPDQFTLRQFSTHELGPDHKPLFAQIVLVSSHTPFAPVPPYLGDWQDAGDFKTVPDADWPRIYAPPDWNNLDRPYLDSIAYDLKTLGAWLKGLDRDSLVIMLGDHQPPEITRVAGQPWTVPVYVLSRDADLVQPFAALGYVAGDTPPARDNPEGMENFLGEFLSAYQKPIASPRPVSAPPQNLDAQAASQP
ncbi:MAG TPA: sulfatase-like hydrolase/transferase [Stellaceae bacterium]